MKKTSNNLLHHLALWLPIICVTPLIIATQNPDDFPINFASVATILAGLSILLAVVTWLITKTVSNKIQNSLSAFIVALATVLVFQAYIVYGLFDYGQLDGSIIKWSEFGWKLWTEVLTFFSVLIILTLIYKKRSTLLNTISSVLIIFSVAQLVVVLPQYFKREVKFIAEEKIDDSVYGFSSTENIIHIIADGFQSDVVKQVFEENPILAKEFTGFTFFENHLGRFQATAPTIPTILSGEYFDLNKGYKTENVAKDLIQTSYTNKLFDAGFQMDFVPISEIYCHKQANSCVSRSFNDLKARGYVQNKSLLGNTMLLFDISLFRHTPMYFKEKVYDDGGWLLSANIARDSSPYPDPVIREWTNNMRVTTTDPVYKWYHFIGTHIPAQWDENCNFQGRLPQSREHYLKQTHCILKDMALLFKELKQKNIYDNTTIVINGDHGCNIPANDLYGTPGNVSIVADPFLGVTRPLFMLKRQSQNGVIHYSDAPTTLEDIAPTILNSAGLDISHLNGSLAFEKIYNENEPRIFHRYVSKTFWTGKAIGYNEYEVKGDIRDRSNWQLKALQNRETAPSSYDHMSFDSAYDFSIGMALSKSLAATQKDASVYGKEFYILLSDTTQPLNSDTRGLSITSKIYEHSKGQKMTLSINNTVIAEDIIFEPIFNKWVTHNIKIPADALLPENNLMRFEFSQAHKGKGRVAVSAKIQSIILE